MNLKKRIIIKSKVEEIKKINKKIFFSGLKKYNYKTFIKKLESLTFVLDSINHLKSGNIIILRNSLNEKFLENAKIILNKFSKDKKPINPKIKTGIKNGYYISKNLNTKGYKTVDTSFYFFSWNKDKTGIYNKIIKIYKPLKILNGLKKNEITNNRPKDGIIERLHIIKYPSPFGQISRHYDPINVSIFNFGLYATEFGKDYSKGGFFVVNKKNKKILIDKKIKKTDIVLFIPSLIHGVDKIKNSKGRWFINVNHIQSHEVKNRQFTKKY